MKNKFIVYSLMGLMSSVNIRAQASYDQNSVPIYGNDNCGFGFNALNNNSSSTGPGNTATGNSALFNNLNGEFNTANGMMALFNNSSGNANVALGFQSLFNNDGSSNTATGHSSLYSNQSGNYNSATGRNALLNNNSGNYNTATGYAALTSNDADGNTGFGHSALSLNNSGTANVGIGKNAIRGLYPGNSNAALGYNALSCGLFSNATYNYNIAVGEGALFNIGTADYNIAVGGEALYTNQSGYDNIAVGDWAMRNNTTGHDNIAFGLNALKENISSWSNIALGSTALYYHNNTTSYFTMGNVAVGDVALQNTNARHTTGVGYWSLITALTNPNGAPPAYDGNSVCGAFADLSNQFTNATAIGYMAVVNNNNKIRLGDPNVTTVETKVAISTTSDGRFKFNISEDDIKGLEFIEKLRPVVYNFDTKKYAEFLYKSMPDSVKKIHLSGNNYSNSTAQRQSGFIAQEVEKTTKEIKCVFNGVSAPANEDGNYALSYDMFVVPLVKAVQEQQIILEKQKNVNDALQQEIDERNIMLSGLQKQDDVFDQLYKFETGFTMQVEPGTKDKGTVINYSLPDHLNSVYLTVYDLTGKQIQQLSLVNKTTGSVTIPSDKLNAGIYICSFIADNKILGSDKMAIAGN